METWKEFNNSGYFVSDKGNVIGKRSGCLLVHQPNSVGYPRVKIYYKGRPARITVHRLVWITFKGRIPSNKVVDHIDDNKTNPALTNLQLLSQAKNVKKGWHIRRGNSYTWFPSKQIAA